MSRLLAVRHSPILLQTVKFFLVKVPASVMDCALKEETAAMTLRTFKFSHACHVRYKTNVALFVF